MVRRGPAWLDILEHWGLVEVDLHERYGFDAGAPEALESRSWQWLRLRIFGLLQVPPTIALDGAIVPATRIARALRPVSEQPEGG